MHRAIYETQCIPSTTGRLYEQGFLTADASVREAGCVSPPRNKPNTAELESYTGQIPEREKGRDSFYSSAEPQQNFTCN